MLALLLIKVNSVSSACPPLGLLLLYARHLSVPATFTHLQPPPPTLHQRDKCPHATSRWTEGLLPLPCPEIHGNPHLPGPALPGEVARGRSTCFLTFQKEQGHSLRLRLGFDSV